MTAPRSDRGRGATTPTDIPARGWKDVLSRTWHEAKEDHLLLLAAGVAFFGLLALVPTLFATVAIYGLVADPSDVQQHVDDLFGAAPTAVQDFVQQQLRQVTEQSTGANTIGAAVALVIALWSASSGMKHLMDALNATYDEREGRGFVRVRGTAIVLTLGAIVFALATIAVITVVPRLGPLAFLTWPLLAAGFVAALAVLYHYAPSRDNAEWRWTTPGALVATALWLLASIAFSIYAANFGRFNETYGSLGGIVVVMLWLFISAAAVLLGGELDAEMERQTSRDTTIGRDRPMGQRDAYAADTVGPTAEEASTETRRRDQRAKR